MRRALALLVAVLVAACAGAAPTPQIVYITQPPQPAPTPIVIYVTPAPTTATTAPTPIVHLLTGTIIYSGPAAFVAPDGCAGTGGYSDMTQGTTVTIRDQANAVIAATALGGGTIAGTCNFPFSVNVPDVPFYSIEVGHRGALTYSRQDLAAKGWQIALTLGS